MVQCIDTWSALTGLATQAVPLYLSEMSPVNIRGTLNIMFQLSITIGILVAQCINFGKHVFLTSTNGTTSEP
jgi:hypothetical protein